MTDAALLRNPSPAAGSRFDPAGNRLLAALRSADRGHLEPHLKVVALRRGQVLFEPGDDVTLTHFPCRVTMASLQVVTASGREIEAATVGREGAIGGIVSAGSKPAFGRAVVQAPGAAFRIETARLEEAKSRSPAVGDLFDRYADTVVAQLMQSVACNALHDIEQRACRWLLAAHDRTGEDLIHLTQESLAEMLGVQRTSVTAVSRALQAKGLIRYRRGRVEVLDRAGLEHAACECYRAVEDHFARLLPEVAE